MSEPGGEPGIRTGLNRVKTHTLNPNIINKHNHYNLHNGTQKGKKIVGWFKARHSKDHSQDVNNSLSDSEYLDPEVNAIGKEVQRITIPKVGHRSNVDQFSSGNAHTIKGPKGLKSFSHELGLQGDLRPVYTRAHSYNDFKELLGSFHSRFDAAKEVVNVELASLSVDLMEQLQNRDFLDSKDEELTEEDLLIQCNNLIQMSSIEFHVKCEQVVQDLKEKRKLCQRGLLEWLLTRMLFILSRCVRLLHFERGSQQVVEKSLHKLKKCLDNVPCVETSWDPDLKVTDPGCRYDMNLVSGIKNELQDQSDDLLMNSSKDFMVVDANSTSKSTLCDAVSSAKERFSDDNELVDPVEQEQRIDACDLVICRICENEVPTSLLESHSYICAHAEKCDLDSFDIDGRLSKLAEMLEYITESFNSRLVTSFDSPESSHGAVRSEGCSPKASDWKSKGVEVLFEDLHDMDTASIDNAHNLTTNLRNYLSMKLGHVGPPSCAGSMASGSSANTPRSRHFDFSWLDLSNPSEMEDVKQITEIVDIARCAARGSFSGEGAHEFLLACIEDLQDILQHNKVKALLVDTFGGRIESLMREKLLHVCDLLGVEGMKNPCSYFLHSSFLMDTASQSSISSTPPHSSLKERTSIDDFEIIKPISRGAFGKVFLARKRITGDLFAIKVLNKLDIIRKNDIERILAERNILITVRNPFVVRFFYSFTSRENLFLVMEYLNGGDLFSLLRKVGCLEEDVARIYIAELVLALEYLHSCEIIHRDLKPDNILIAHDGHIKLTDFGLSKIGLMNSTGDLVSPNSDEIDLIDSQCQTTHKTGDRNCQSAAGTPDYLAPEILLGTDHGDAADWWSVGIILFELVTGTPPFCAEHPEIIFDNILSRRIPWPSVPEDMSHEAQDLIDRFLAHDPEERLGAKGSSEVKAHPFFKGVNWETLALQKAAFVPNPDSMEDTSYFVSRFAQFSTDVPRDSMSNDSDSDSSDSLNGEVEERDGCSDLELFNSKVSLAWLNFSYKNLSQLASINRDVIRWKNPSKSSSKASSVVDGSNSSLF